MTVNLLELLSVLTGFSAVFGSIYAFSTKEKRIDLKLAEINSKLEMHEYKIHGCYESLKHKASRLQEDIKALERKLDKLNHDK